MADKKVYNTFDFICRLGIPKETDKFKAYKREEYDSGWIKDKLVFSAKTDESSVLLTVEGGFFNKKDYKIKTFSKDVVKKNGDIEKGGKLEVAWEDRKKKTIVDKVAQFKKIVFDTSSDYERFGLEKYIKRFTEGKTTDEEIAKIEEKFGTVDIAELQNKLKELESKRVEFVSEVDMIEFLRKELPKHDKELFNVRGNIEYSEWNGKVYQNFVPKVIEKAHDTKQRLHGMIDIFYNEASLVEDGFETTRKYVINGYVRSYDGQLKKEIFIPVQFIINGNRIKQDDEKGNKKLEGLVKPFRVDDEDIYELQYKVKFMNGADRKEITMEDLTEFQREQVMLGNTSFEELKRQLGGSKFGDNVNEIRLFAINLVDFPNGAVKTNFTIEDLSVIRPEKEEKQSEETSQVDDEIQVADEDLF